MSCDNVITVQDLETDKKHSTFYREVITGKAGGTGADIDSATNAVTGQTQATLPKVLSNVGFSPAGFDFTTGGTLTERDKAIFYQTDGNWYSWGGALPKVVPPASSPASTGGIADNAWNVSTSAFMYRDWEGFTAELLAQGGVPDNGQPDELGNSQRVDAIKSLSRSHTLAVTPAYVDAYKTNTNSDTDAIDAAMAASKHVIFSARKYTYTKELVSIGHTLEGAVSETFSSAGTIVEFDIPVTPASGFAIRNRSIKGSISNIKFMQKNWDIALNGFKAERKVSAIDVCFTHFNGNGLVLESIDSIPVGCYGSTFYGVTCAYNAKHGIVLGGSANAVVITNPACNWNGAPAYNVQPTVVGVYDGIFSGGKNSDYPGNPSVFNDPQGVTIIGGDLSYNSRAGLNLNRFFDGVVIGSYSEYNLYKDLVIKEMYGSNIVNFMAQGAPLIEVPETDSLSGIPLSSYPNKISVRGVDYGDGSNTSLIPYSGRIKGLKFSGTDGTMHFGGNSKGGIGFKRFGPASSVQFELNTVSLTGRTAAFGAGAVEGYAAPADQLTVVSTGAENVAMVQFLSGTQATKFYRANGGNPSSTAAAMSVQASSITGRSINAGGTVNTSGADYAEYMIKSLSCGEIKKGDICGVDANGELTDKFDNAISFVIKSTDPSFVGGDTWFTEQAPEPEIDDDGDAYTSCPEYIRLLSEYNDRMNDARQRVDRIAFCGQVPCNVFNATAGDYIVPKKASDGSISGLAVASPDMGQYMSAVGRVLTVSDDGRAWVTVKTM